VILIASARQPLIVQIFADFLKRETNKHVSESAKRLSN